MLRCLKSLVNVGFRHTSALKHLKCSNKSSFQVFPSILSVYQLHKNYFTAFSSQKNPDLDLSKTRIQDHGEYFTAHESSKVKMKTRLGINTSNFVERAEQGLPIIDKTRQIGNLITDYKAVFVMGPRRFGKTLDLTTVQAIFTKGADWWKKYCKDLEIVKNQQYNFPVHSVLRLDFSKKADILTLKMDIAISLMYLIEISGLNEELKWYTNYFKENLTVDAAFFSLLKTAMLEICGKYGKGVVVLIDEYDSPIITLAEKILQGSPDCRDLTNNPEMSALVRFMSQFFASLKELRVTEVNGQACVTFEYLTGAVPISQLGLFSGANDVFVARHICDYYDVIGYTEKEIETAFGPHIDNVASKLLSERKTKKGQQDLTQQDKDKDLTLEQMVSKIKQDIRLNYNGFRFSHDQPNALYSPFGINSLFDVWRHQSDLNYPPFFPMSGSSTLLWRSAKTMSPQTTRSFLWALTGESDSEPIFKCKPQDLQVNQTLEQLFLDPMRLGFFSGAFSVDTQESTAKSWRLILTNNEIRAALVTELDRILELQDRVDNILNMLSNHNYSGYFTAINKVLEKMSAIMPTSKEAVKSEHEIEPYGYSHFVFLHSRIKDFNQEKKDDDKDKLKYLEFIKNKEISTSTRQRSDFLFRFDIPTSESETKKVLWLIEFKCKEGIGQILKATKDDLESKLPDLKTFKEKYNEQDFEKCEKIFIAANLGFGKIQSAIVYKQNNKNQLEQVLRLP